LIVVHYTISASDALFPCQMSLF